MRLAKTLSKMNKEEVRAQLPKWFEGMIYEEGGEVTNPFSGESCELDAAELSMHDCIKGAEMAMHMGAAFDIDECIDVIHQGLDWFIKRNPTAYMILLD